MWKRVVARYDKAFPTVQTLIFEVTGSPQHRAQILLCHLSGPRRHLLTPDRRFALSVDTHIIPVIPRTAGVIPSGGLVSGGSAGRTFQSLPVGVRSL